MVIESAWPILKETWQQTKAIWELPCLIIYFLFVDTLSLQLAARQIFQKQNHLSNLQQMPGRLMKREVLPPGPPPAINTNKARPSFGCLMLALGSIDYVVRELWEGCLCDRNIFKKLTTESSRKESDTPWLHNIISQILGSNLSRKKNRGAIAADWGAFSVKCWSPKTASVACSPPSCQRHQETLVHLVLSRCVCVCVWYFFKKSSAREICDSANEVKWAFFGSLAWFQRSGDEMM